MRKIKGIMTEEEVCIALDIGSRRLQALRKLGFPARAISRELCFYVEKEIVEFLISLPRYTDNKLDLN